MTISKESEIDALKLYFGEPFVIENDTYNDIIINQPTIGDIIKSGEKKIYSTINIFIANPTMYRMQLWDLGIDWNKMSDFSLFCMLVPSIDSKSTKEWMIEEDRMSFEQHKNDVYKSTLLPLISTCLNHPGFKYKKNELREVGIVEFMDSVQRLQVYESSTALLKGIYSGFVDASKIDKNELNFMREISLKN